MQLLSTLKRLDLYVLASLGIFAVFSFSALTSIGLSKDPPNFWFASHQFIIFGGACILMLFLSYFNYQNLKYIALPLFLVSCLVLASTLFFGREIRGTRGWLYLGTFGFQAVELVKLSLILFLAYYFSRYTRVIGTLKHLCISGVLTGIPIVLTLMQPDFGSAVVLIGIWLGMVFLSDIPKKYVITMICAALVFLAVFWLFLFQDYQKQRIITFLNPTHDVQGQGYNVRQALIAIGSGQLLGRGLGLGSQSHLKFLPETQTDFIFSVIAEEMGMIGVLFLLAAFGLLVIRTFYIIKKSRDDFGVFCCIGIISMIMIHLLINIGGNIGLVPVTGIVLPFISFGGSALLIDILALGIIQSVAVHKI